MIGKRPKTAPSVADSRARPTGIPKAVTATTIATAREARPAQWALTLRAPRRTKMVRSGSSATSAERVKLPSGARSCWNMVAPVVVDGDDSVATYGLTNGGADRTVVLPYCGRA